jgi:hypothetical protein
MIYFADVFLNFKSKEGNFSDADTRSLLSLYNAAYMRKHGEKILDKQSLSLDIDFWM